MIENCIKRDMKDGHKLNSKKIWLQKVVVFFASGKPYEIVSDEFFGCGFVDFTRVIKKHPDVPWPWSWTARYVMGKISYYLDRKNCETNVIKRKYKDMKFWLKYGIKTLAQTKGKTND